MPDLATLILCMIFTLIWARIAAVIANKAKPKTLNRVTGIVLLSISAVVIAVNYIF